MEQSHDVLSLDDMRRLHPFFASRFGQCVARVLFRLLDVDKTNRANAAAQCDTPGEGAARLIESMKLGIEVENEQQMAVLKEGAFITVSNHPYGSIDGISLCAVMGRHRPDFRIMVNEIILRITSISAAFIGVKPHVGHAKENVSSSQGLREAILSLRGGHPLCLFPAGAVSLYGGKKHIEDREWQPSVLKLIKSAAVPVLPVYFHGMNSKFYYWLEHIHIGLRAFFLPREAFNKAGQVIKMSIGDLITVEEQQACADINELGVLLRNRTYALAKKKP